MNRLFPPLYMLCAMVACSEPTLSDTRESAMPMATASQVEAPTLAPLPGADDDTIRGDDRLAADVDRVGPMMVDASDSGGARPSEGLLSCQSDDECFDGQRCDDTGTCTAMLVALGQDIPMDGLSRIGAAAFDILPATFEVWMDRGGRDCPGNKIGRFDGRLDEPTPDDPCKDSFQDADGDGLFDAVWLGGHDFDRPVKALDFENPPQGRVVVFAGRHEPYVLVSLDLFSIDAPRVDALTKRLSEQFAIPAHRFGIHVTGVWGAPDAVGTSGPSLKVSPRAEGFSRRLGSEDSLLNGMAFRSGVDESWWAETSQKVAIAILDASQNLETVRVKSARAPLQTPPIENASSGSFWVPDADGDGELNDAYDLAVYRAQRQPFATETFLPGIFDSELKVMSFEDEEEGHPRLFMIGWSAAPSSQGQAANRLTADFPGRVRQVIEQRYPGSFVVWLTGAASDTFRVRSENFVMTSENVADDMREQGDDDDNRGGEERRTEGEPIDRLGQFIAQRALSALEGVDSQDFNFAATGRYVWLPVTNPRFDIAARLGLMPIFARWVNGQETTNAWARGVDFPECGGFGCLRYRLDRLQINEQIQVLTTPGALDQGYVLGRETSSIIFEDRPNFGDLDSDGIQDERDEEIRFQGRAGQNQVSVVLQSAVNPQTFDAIEGLGSSDVWIIGRTNGGIGSMRPTKHFINVFEGVLDPLLEFIDTAGNDAIGLCQAGYPCGGNLDLGMLTHLILDAHESVLANIPGSREAWCEMDIPQFEGAARWRIEKIDGTVLAEGEDLTITAGGHVHTPSTDLQDLGVSSGDMLFLPDFRLQPWPIGGLVPIDLATHPNALDTRVALTPMGGDMVYNTACELLFDGLCPYPRRVEHNPNRQLPQLPTP